MKDFDFLGVGWKFPVQAGAVSGQIKMSEYEEDISEAVRIILHTSRGERIMRPDFGCGLRSFVFSSINLSSLSQMAEDVKNSLILWEPRIEDITVNVTSPDGKGRVDISVSYAVRVTNNRYNTVFPYYLDEGSQM